MGLPVSQRSRVLSAMDSTDRFTEDLDNEGPRQLRTEFLPHQAVDGLVAGLFLAGALYSFLIRNQEEETAEVREPPSAGRTTRTAGTASAPCSPFGRWPGSP